MTGPDPVSPVPPAQSQVPAPLIESYRRARYEVLAGPGIDLVVDRPDPWLAQLMARHQAPTAAVITAWNPFSQPLALPENRARQARLKHELVDAGCDWLPMLGHDPQGTWPGEEMLLVIGASSGQLAQLGTRFDQNAILLATRTDPVPRLLLLR